jgi:hypothetical protein
MSFRKNQSQPYIEKISKFRVIDIASVGGVGNYEIGSTRNNILGIFAKYFRLLIEFYNLISILRDNFPLRNFTIKS